MTQLSKVKQNIHQHKDKSCNLKNTKRRTIYKTVLIIFPLNLQTITITLDVVTWRWGGCYAFNLYRRMPTFCKPAKYEEQGGRLTLRLFMLSCISVSLWVCNACVFLAKSTGFNFGSWRLASRRTSWSTMKHNSVWPNTSRVFINAWPDIYRVVQKIGTFLYTLWLHQIPTNFQTVFTARIRGKLVTVLSLKIPPYFKCVATLPCEMSVS